MAGLRLVPTTLRIILTCCISAAAHPSIAPAGWRPRFIDYLYLGFTNATAFSPTDVMPLVPWAKITMAVQSVISIAIRDLLIARAVNIFTSPPEKLSPGSRGSPGNSSRQGLSVHHSGCHACPASLQEGVSSVRGRQIPRPRPRRRGSVREPFARTTCSGISTARRTGRPSKGSSARTSATRFPSGPSTAPSARWCRTRSPRTWTRPNPDSGEEYPHTNTQLYNILDEHNRFKIGDDMTAPWNAPQPGDADDGWVRHRLHQQLHRRDGPPAHLRRVRPDHDGVHPRADPGAERARARFGVFDHWFCEVPSQTFTNRSFWTAATSSGFVVNAR